MFFLGTFITGQASNNYINAELISEVESIQPGKTFWVALKLNAQPDWHTYWRNPGDSGLPTSITWNLHEGFKHSEINWPAPHLFVVEGIANYGYEKETLLLIEITPPEKLKAGSDIILEAKASWLACRIECVPETKDLTLSLPVETENPEIDKRWKEKFIKAKSNLPIINNSINFAAELDSNSLIISAVQNEKGFKNTKNNIRFFPYEAGYYNNSADQKLIQKENRFTLHIQLDDFKIGNPENVYGILLNENGWGNKNRKSLEVKINLTK